MNPYMLPSFKINVHTQRSEKKGVESRKPPMHEKDATFSVTVLISTTLKALFKKV